MTADGLQKAIEIGEAIEKQLADAADGYKQRGLQALYYLNARKRMGAAAVIEALRAAVTTPERSPE